MMVLLAGSAAIVVFTGPVADQAARLLGVGGGLAVWSVAEWPVLVVLVALVIAILYWAAPNVRVPRFRWLSPGSLLAVVLWLAASGGFALYAAKTSGATTGPTEPWPD
jgi:membrane protein